MYYHLIFQDFKIFSNICLTFGYMIIIFYNHKSYCIQLQSNLLLTSYVISKALKCISIYKLINQYVKLMDKCQDN